MTEAEKQIEINRIINDILQENIYTDSSMVDVGKKANEYCIRFFEIFTDGFRPHYFEVHQFLFESVGLVDRASSTTKRFIWLIQKYLEEELKREEVRAKGIKKYCTEPRFRYDVDMFFSAIIHEITVAELKYNIRDILVAKANYQSIITRANEELGELNQKYEELSQKMQKKENELKKQQEQTSKIVNELESTKLQVNKVLEDAKDILPNLLTIMGIFVAIIIAIVAIYLSAVIHTNAFLTNNVPVSERLWYLSTLGTMIFNTICVFVYLISKLTNKSIAMICSGCENSTCQKNKCSFLKRIFKKYGNFVIINILLISTIIVCSIIIANNKSYINNHYSDVTVSGSSIE